MMKMTNEEMLQNILLTSRLKETHTLGYAIARNTRLLKETAKEYVDMHDKLIAEFTDPETGRAKISNEVYKERLGEYMDIEHEFTPFKVTEEVFCSGNLTSQQMEKLFWMVDVKEEKIQKEGKE